MKNSQIYEYHYYILQKEQIKEKKHTHTHKEKYRQKLCKQRQGELLVVAENFLLAEVTNAL